MNICSVFSRGGHLTEVRRTRPAHEKHAYFYG